MAVKKSTKKKTGATRKTEQGRINWSLIVVALLVVGFISFLVYLDKIPTGGEQQAASSSQLPANNSPKDSSQKDKEKQKTQSKPRHQFDFYTVLPDREVKVNTGSVKPQGRKIPEPIVKTESKNVSQVSGEQQNTSKTGAISLYQLQVGAFKSLSKADAMKARLAFIGVESNIQVIQNNGQKMYRVRVGPSTNEQKIKQIKKQLKAQNINTFVQKLNG